MNRKSHILSLKKIWVVVAMMSGFVRLGALSGSAIQVSDSMFTTGYLENITGFHTLDGDGYRTPLRMLVVDYDTGWNQVAVQGVVIPEEFRPIKIAAEGANWSHPAFNALSLATINTIGVPTYDLANKLMRDGYDSSDFDNTEAGIRIRGMIGDVETHKPFQRSNGTGICRKQPKGCLRRSKLESGYNSLYMRARYPPSRPDDP